MKVIGVGLPRTGTMSLKIALEMLGFGPCYHMTEVFGDPQSWPLWLKAANGERIEWSQIFGRWNSTTDAPGCVFWRQLADYYPNAKLILSVRDAHKWFASTQATILRQANHEALGLAASDVFKVIGAVGWSPLADENHDEATMLQRFNEHNAAVKAAFGPERLLVYEASQGWEPLCRFLGVPVPAQPYPKANSTEDFQKMVESRQLPKGAHP
ncbi:MAG TPA: sulfotransferase [Candidatus Acidoferrum sp.]|nr:sulfotransferase [Candidatus Acidoferrum sp.]